MWLFKVVDVIYVIQIIVCILQVYGVFIYIGDLVLIGIVDFYQFDYGEVVDIYVDELLVFWVCGVML